MLIVITLLSKSRYYFGESIKNTLFQCNKTCFSSINYADFTWMINNQVKTNTRQTCTYDRILINGDKFIKAIVQTKNTTVNFRQRFGMTLDQARRISDHLPIIFAINW
jgi:hypothetical protein